MKVSLSNNAVTTQATIYDEDRIVCSFLGAQSRVDLSEQGSLLKATREFIGQRFEHRGATMMTDSELLEASGLVYCTRWDLIRCLQYYLEQLEMDQK